MKPVSKKFLHDYLRRELPKILDTGYTDRQGNPIYYPIDQEPVQDMLNERGINTTLAEKFYYEELFDDLGSPAVSE